MFYVYAHINPITSDVFYIGKGMGQRKDDRKGRSKFWHRVVNKHGFASIVLADGLTEQQAFELERQYIAKYGMRIHGGKLVNLTNGGSGGRTIFEHNIESVRTKLSNARKGSGNPNYGKKTWLFGKQMPEETREKLRLARMGKKLKPEVKTKVLAGLEKARLKCIENASPVICMITGKRWKNKHECAVDLGLTAKGVKTRIQRNTPIKGHYLKLEKNIICQVVH